MVLFLRTKIEFKWVIFFFFRLWSGEFFLPAWLVISFWFLSDLAGMVLSMGAGEHGDGVAFGAHVGGTICGLALIALEKPFRRSPPEEAAEEEEHVEELVQPVTRIARAPIRVQLKPKPLVVAEAEAACIYLCVDQTQAGPYTGPQIRQMFVEGTIPPEALYWQEGMRDWHSAEELRPMENWGDGELG